MLSLHVFVIMHYHIFIIHFHYINVLYVYIASIGYILYNYTDIITHFIDTYKI